jgi:hypothetical protein
MNVFYPLRIADVNPAFCSWRGINLYWRRFIPPLYEVWVKDEPDMRAGRVLKVPGGLDDVASLGRRAAGEGTAGERAVRMARFLKSRCSYTLEAIDMPAGVPPVHAFMFRTRKGNCEHFASALAVMLNGNGIPARLVTGFMVREFNTTGGYYVVRAENAHAWVEYFDNGWQTLEATPQAFSSGRRQAGIVDAMRFRWIRWVIQYSLDDQVRIATTIFLASPDIEHEVGYALASGLGLIVLAAGVGFVILRWRSSRKGHYESVRRAFAEKGLDSGSRLHKEHRRGPRHCPRYTRSLSCLKTTSPGASGKGHGHGTENTGMIKG